MSAWKTTAYLVQRFLLGRRFLYAQSDIRGLRFRVRASDVIGRHIYKYGSFDPHLTAYLDRTLKFEDGDLALDIGANIGWYSLLFDRLAAGKDVTVLACEPDPGNCSLLNENIALNSAEAVQVCPAAVADTVGTATLFQHSDSNRGRHSLLPVNDGGSVEVRTVVMDDYLAEKGLAERTPRVIKIDVEGFELMVLKGADRVLRRCPLLIIEYSPYLLRAGGFRPGIVIDALLELGFTLQRLGEAGPEPVDIERLRSQKAQEDLICVRQNP
jgi:FkbM family methyltransferase